MLPLPARLKRARNETRDLTSPIRAALNKLSGVRVVRNTDRGLMIPASMIHLPDPPKIMTGLGEGGADLVGIVRFYAPVGTDGTLFGCGSIGHCSIGRAFALEVKWKKHSAPRRRMLVQERWRSVFREFGGFATVVFCEDADDGIAQAVEAVKRCRYGLAQ